jgi:hypothetical protein
MSRSGGVQLHGLYQPRGGYRTTMDRKVLTGVWQLLYIHFHMLVWSHQYDMIFCPWLRCQDWFIRKLETRMGWRNEFAFSGRTFGREAAFSTVGNRRGRKLRVERLLFAWMARFWSEWCNFWVGDVTFEWMAQICIVGRLGTTMKSQPTDKEVHSGARASFPMGLTTSKGVQVGILGRRDGAVMTRRPC